MRDDRNIPKLDRYLKNWPDERKNIINFLEENVYGKIPERDLHWDVTEDIKKDQDKEVTIYNITVHGQYGETKFEIQHWKNSGYNFKMPVVIYLTNKKQDGSWPKPGEKGMPGEKYLENGYAVVVCIADEIEPDDEAIFPNKLGAVIQKKEKEQKVGALACWAFGMKIAGDIIKKRADVDESKVIVAGCSRFGKAALWCGARYDWIAVTVSINSGCGGAAINKGKRGEHLKDMVQSFPHWLSSNVRPYAENEENMTFDQHFLLASIAPRKLFVTSSTRDCYSDPYAEFLGLAYASPAYEYYGEHGIGTWIWPPAGILLDEKNAGYYLREGEHGIETEDWDALYIWLKNH